MNDQAFNPAIVQCLRILARRGRAIREARQQATGNAGEFGDLTASPANATGDEAERTLIMTPIVTMASGGGDV